MKIIDYKDIESLNISLKECYRWTETMISHKQKALLPPKTHMSIAENGFCNVMPCLLWEMDKARGGVKIVTRYPTREPALDSRILLFDSESGEYLAFMDGNWITAMRTGAVAAHSVITFAKSNWDTIGMIGLGNVARSSLLMIDTLVDRTIHVKLLRYKNQAEEFMKRFEKHNNLEFEMVDNVKDCIKGSDVVISCATYFENDIACDEWFDEGILLVPVHTRGFTNCDLFFDKVFVDDTEHVKDFKNFKKFRRFSEVTDVINGRSSGRENDQERIIAYNIGVSIHDINFASRIYLLFEENPDMFNALRTVDMNEPNEKFWV